MSRLQLGKVVITANAQEELDPVDVLESVSKHQHHDWGNMCEEDKNQNDLAVEEGLRIHSSYKDRNNKEFWIITEYDRSVTTILLPEDY